MEESTENKRSALLKKAEEIINGDRNVQYGDPNADFRRTATYWSTHLQERIDQHIRVEIANPGALMPFSLTPEDIAIMMALLKISRLAWTPDKADNWLDLAGYAACGFDVSEALASDL